MDGGLFRREALDAASRIEALPHMLTVTSVSTRRAVACLALALFGALAWSAYVRVPVQIGGQGVLVDKSGTLVSAITAASQGYVAEVLVGIGDRVTAGQPLVRLVFPDRTIELGKARAELDAARGAFARKEVLRAADAKMQDQSYRQAILSLDTRIAGLKSTLGWREQRVNDLVALEAKGFSTSVTVVDARVELEQTADELARAQADRIALDARHEQGGAQRERDALADRLDIERLEQDLATLTATLAADSIVRADADGRVAAVNTRHGALVVPGQQLIDVLTAGARQVGGLEAIVFVPMATGKRVRAGDRTLVAPASLPEGIEDQLIATVRSVSDVPVSLATLRNLLGSDELAEKAAQGGPPFAVRVTFDAAPDRQGYAWTSSAAPDVSLTPGTPVSAHVTVEETPLLALAVPALKRLFGFGSGDWQRKS